MNLETTLKTSLGRDKKGYLRVKKLDVQMHLNVDEKDKPRVSTCLAIFENHCTVTQSVRKGIAVSVNIK